MRRRRNDVMAVQDRSGWGREMGHEVLVNCLETKALCIQL
jgi:hypothetical protein